MNRILCEGKGGGGRAQRCGMGRGGDAKSI